MTLRQSDGHQALFFFLQFSSVKIPKRCSDRTAGLRSCPRTKSKPQPVHHFCQSRLSVLQKTTSLESSRNLYPQIAECLLRAFGKSLYYNYQQHTQCFINMSQILKLTQSLCVDCGGCSFRGAAPTKQFC